jgi:predicted permease
VVVFVVGTRISGALYLSGWAQGAWGSPSRARSVPVATASGRSRRRSPTLALVIKDWRIRRRDLAQLTGLLMPFGFFALVLAFNGPRLLRAIQPLGSGPLTALVAIVPVLLILLSLTTALGLSAVSLEGRGIWIYAASPNTMRGLLEAKCWAAAVPVMIVSLVLGTALEVFVHAGLAWSVGALALLVVVSGALACVMVGLGGVVGRVDWTDARRMIHPVGGLVALFVQFGLIFAVAGLVVVPLLVASFFHQSVLGLFLAGVLAASLAAVLAALVALVLAEQRLRRLEV